MRVADSTFCLTCLMAAAMAAASCSDSSETPDPSIPSLNSASRNIAQIRIGQGLECQAAGEDTFNPWNRETPLEPGVTLRIKKSIASFLFMNNVEVQLGDGIRESELILEGATGTGLQRILVMGLKKGAVRINSLADEQVALILPHGRVEGRQAYFKADLQRDKDGGYRSFIQAFSQNITVTNEQGRLDLPYWGVIRMDEKGPPTVTRKTQRR